jgi:predicted PurR-regulated permease PerM
MLSFRSKEKGQTVRITISNRTVVRVLLIVIVSMIGVAALRQATHSLVIIFTAFFLALALNGPVHWVAQRLPGKRRGSRTLATGISFFLVIAVLIGFVASIAPPLVRQTNSFISAAPQLVRETKNENSDVGKLIRKYHLEGQVNDVSKQLSERIKHAGSAAVSTVGKVGSSVFAVLTILALTFMMLIEGPRWLRVFRDIIPDEHQEHSDKLARDMYRVVKGYVNGQVILAAIAATLLLPALIALHISYPAALLVIVFVCGLIPMVGHTIGAAIVTTVALFHSPVSAIIILAYYILYQQIENYIIQPRIQSNTTNMSPLLVFASVVIGVNFGGLFGGLVAIPLAGCTRIVLLDYLRGRHILDAETFKEVTTHKA